MYVMNLIRNNERDNDVQGGASALEFWINQVMFDFEDLDGEESDGLKIDVKSFTEPIGVTIVIDTNSDFKQERFEFTVQDFNMFYEDLKLCNKVDDFKIERWYEDSQLNVLFVKTYVDLRITITDATNSKMMKGIFDDRYIYAVTKALRSGRSWYVNNYDESARNKMYMADFEVINRGKGTELMVNGKIYDNVNDIPLEDKVYAFKNGKKILA